MVQLSGLAVETFQILYSDYIAVRTPTKNKVEYDDEYRIWQILQKEKDSAIGLALWMRWYMDLQLTELVELTWDQVDFERNRVHLKTRDVELVQSVRTRLLEELGRRAEGDDPHVLLTGHSRTPVNLSNFSKLLRTTLIRGGVENLSFRDVRQTPAADGEKRAILALAKSRKGLVRSDVMEHMGLSAYAAKRRLDELVDERALVKVYATYYPAEQVVPLEEQESCIRAYLQEHGKATWDDMHLLLGLERRQCARILNRMVKEGVLLKQSDAFYLAETTEESKVS